MSRKKVFVTLAVIFVLAAMTTAVYAYMLHRSQSVNNQFVPAQVDCTVSETFQDNEKTAIQVTNISNIEAYVRVRLVCNWQDSKGNPVVRDADPPTFTLGDGWVMHDGMYYYRKPLDPKTGTTGNLLADGAAIERPAAVKETVTANGVTTEYWYYPVIEVIAEAIQSLPETMVEGVWNVTITDGLIE